jgi:excisionase family DNA binding protein
VAGDIAALTQGPRAGRLPEGSPLVPGALGKHLYRVQEAAEALGLSWSTIYQQIRSRRLRSVEVGRSRRIPAEAITEFVKLLRREAEDAALMASRRICEVAVRFRRTARAEYGSGTALGYRTPRVCARTWGRG